MNAGDNQQPQDTREHLPDCPLNGAYGCVALCPCWCHDTADQQVPDAAKLTDEDYAAIEKVTLSTTDWEYERQIADAASVKAVAYIRETEVVPRQQTIEMLHDDLERVADEVAELRGEKAEMQREWHDEMTANGELRQQLDASSNRAMWWEQVASDRKEAMVERDAAREQAQALVKAIEERNLQRGMDRCILCKSDEWEGMILIHTPVCPIAAYKSAQEEK